MTATATAIAAVESHPTAQSGRGNVKRPMTRGCIVMIIIITATVWAWSALKAE